MSQELLLIITLHLFYAASGEYLSLSRYRTCRGMEMCYRLKKAGFAAFFVFVLSGPVSSCHRLIASAFAGALFYAEVDFEMEQL